jgi:SulP family sulfate permease
MLKQLGGAGAVVLVTTAGIIWSGVIAGVLGGLTLAALLVVVPAARTKIEVRTARLASGALQRTPVLEDVSTVGAPSADLLIARLSGPLTFLSQGQLIRLLDGPPWPRFVVLELGAVSFIDSGGVNELEYLVDFLAIRGGKVVVVGCSLRLRDTLRRAGLVQRLAGGTDFVDLESALDAVAGVPDPKTREGDLARAAGW